MLIFSFALMGLIGSLHFENASLKKNLTLVHFSVSIAGYVHKSSTVTAIFFKDKNGKHYLDKSQDFSKKGSAIKLSALTANANYTIYLSYLSF